MPRQTRLHLAIAAALAQLAFNAPAVWAADPVDLGAVGTGASSQSAEIQPTGRTPALPAAAVDAPAAARTAVSQGNLESRWPTSEISENFIRNFTPPNSDYTQVLNIAPSIVAPPHPNGIGGGDSKIQFRGFSDGSFNMTWDGIPFNDSNDPTHHSWAYFPGEFIGGVVIDRSPGSAATFGPASYGGTIGLQSQDPTANKGVRVYGSYGSFSTSTVGAQVNTGRLGDDGATSMVFNAQRFKTDGALTHDSLERTSFSGKLAHAVSADTTMTFFASFNQMYSDTGNTTTGTRAEQAQYGNNYLNDTDPSKTNYYKYNNYNLSTDMEYFQVASKLSDTWTVDNKLFTYAYSNTQHYASSLTTPATGLPDGTTYGPKGSAALPFAGPCAAPGASLITATCSNGIIKLNQYRTLGDILRFTKDSSWGQTRLGAWLTQTETNRHGFYANVTDYQTYSNAYANTSYNQKFTSYQTQAYVEHEFHPLSTVAVTPGLKFSRFTHDVTDYPAQNTGLTSNYEFQKNYNDTLPSLDARWRPMKNLTVYAQYTTGVVIPSTGNYDVKLQQPSGVVATPPTVPAQHDRAYQIGSVWKTDRYTVDVDVYQIKFDNFYSTSGTYDTTTNTYPIINNGAVIYKGAEAEFTYVIGSGFSTYANASTNSAKRTLDQTSISPSGTTGIPSNTEALGLFWQDKGWAIGLVGKRIGSQYITTNAPQGASLNPYYLTNAYVNYRLANISPTLKAVTLRAGVNNIGDSQKTVGLSQSGANPGPNDQLTLLPRRNYFVGVSADF